MTAIVNSYFKDIKYLEDYRPRYPLGGDVCGDVSRLYKGQLNSYKDEPAIVYQNGDKVWYRDGNVHRDNDKPAVEYMNGSKQ